MRLMLGMLAAALVLTAPAQAEKVRIGHSPPVAGHCYLMAAVDKGFFKDEGIEPETVQTLGGVATAALLSGDLQVSLSGASAISAIMQGAHLKVVMVGQDHSDWQLWVSSPDIKTLADLKGKQIGLYSRGDTGEIAIRYLLHKEGLPSDYVAFTPLGVGGARKAAIATGKLAASMIVQLELRELQSSPEFKSAHMLRDLTREIEMVYGGVVLSDAMIRDHADLSYRLLRALYKGQEYCRAFREPAVEMITRWSKTDPAAAAEDYHHYLDTMTKDGTVSDQLEVSEIQLRGEMLNIPPARQPKPDGVFDFSMVRRAIRELKDAVWKPVP